MIRIYPITSMRLVKLKFLRVVFFLSKTSNSYLSRVKKRRGNLKWQNISPKNTKLSLQGVTIRVNPIFFVAKCDHFLQSFKLRNLKLDFNSKPTTRSFSKYSKKFFSSKLFFKDSVINFSKNREIPPIRRLLYVPSTFSA